MYGITEVERNTSLLALLLVCYFFMCCIKTILITLLTIMSHKNNNINLALSSIPDNFIAHYSSSETHDCIVIMEKHGNAFARIYWYHEDPATICLNSLSVSEEYRKQGFGTILQEIRERMGLWLNAKTSCLWVKKDSWMHEWYKRRGYEDYQDYEADKNFVWMKKSL